MALVKLVRRPATWIVFAILAGLIALMFISLGATAGSMESFSDEFQIRVLLDFPTAYDLVAGVMVSFGALLGAVLGAAIIGADWAWGTIRSIIARGESRVRYTLVTFVAIALVLAVGVVVTFIIGTGSALVAAGIAGLGTEGASDEAALRQIPELLARTWLGVTQAAAIGFAIAMVFKSQLAGIGAAIALYFAENVLRLVPTLDEILQHFPFAVSSAVIATTDEMTQGGFGDSVPTLDANTAVLWSVGYIVGALLLAAWAARRAQITQ